MNEDFSNHFYSELKNNKILKVYYFYSGKKRFTFIKMNDDGQIINLFTNKIFSILNKTILYFSTLREENFIGVLKKQYENYKNNIEYYKEIYKNDLTIRLYPNINYKIFNFKCYKKILLKKFFIEDDDKYINEENNLKYCLDYLGIKNKNLNCEDPSFIDCLKSKWKFLVEKYNTIFLLFLEKNDILDKLENNEKEEYIKELNSLKSPENLKNFLKLIDSKKKVIEIISLWPNWMQPKPHFVYEN
jgi:hypothetical protein